MRAKLAKHAEDWPWSSLAVRAMTPAQIEREGKPILADWPVDRPRPWLRLVNEPQPKAEIDALHHSVQRGRPFGSAIWAKQAATRLGLESTLRSRGRPRKAKG